MSDSELISLQRANQELLSLNESLRNAQHQLLQSERLASIGQLAAGVAHEINNPAAPSRTGSRPCVNGSSSTI